MVADPRVLERGFFLRLFVSCWLIYAVHWAPFMIREQFPALTLANSGTLNVERFLGWSPDIFPGPRGGAFINNNPGASIVAAVPLWVARPALTVIERWNDALPSSAALRARAEFSRSSAVQGRREWYFMAVAFVAADEAAFVNGANLVVDGGLTAGIGPMIEELILEVG